MRSTTIRAVLIAVACLGIAAMSATRSAPTTQTSEDASPGVKDLIQNSGYMVAVG